MSTNILVYPGAGLSSTCTKSKAVFGEKGSSSQDESRPGDMKITDLFRMLSKRLDKQDNKFDVLQEGIQNRNQRLEEMQLRVPRPRLADMGIYEEKSSELEGIATEAGGRRITPSEPQRQQPLLPPQPPRL